MHIASEIHCKYSKKMENPKLTVPITLGFLEFEQI